MGLAEQLAPAQPEDMDVEIDVPELGPVKLDIAYGGMFYAIVDAKKLDLELLPHNGRRICRLGEMIKVACREQHPVNHPEFDYPGCDILVFTDLQRKDQGKMLGKNAVVMSNGRLSWDNPDSWTGMIDRSPCGTGTCAVMAQLHARGGLELSEEFVHESILGTHFVGELQPSKPSPNQSKPFNPPKSHTFGRTSGDHRTNICSGARCGPTDFRSCLDHAAM